ncbi:hypothetical protein [Gloeocapsa sp. PCC 73106]|uniref:hypothetical protein n=1 Tax=Gloeocapsa sp. PCC 73106 TaxID=102232 RepID=UPI0002ABC136|nr:hypothetical protein [Gloeocapsa sp. PCC 73106]ELR97376.1 hypothetical protein GLO73106DRAFT_00011850 [Gloeocapsa sp. PCC 73106]
MSSTPLKTTIIYPDSDGAPMAESDRARDYLTYSVEALQVYFQDKQDVYVSGNLFIYYQQGVPSMFNTVYLVYPSNAPQAIAPGI